MVEDVDANLLESDGCKRRREGTTVIVPEPKRVKRSSDDLVADVCSALRHVELQQMWAASLRCFLLATAPMVLQTSQEGRSEQDMSFFRLLDEIFQAEEPRLMSCVATCQAKLEGNGSLASQDSKVIYRLFHKNRIQNQ